MATLEGTTVIHGNHCYFLFDGNIVGRGKNINMTVEGSLDEFYEVGNAWLADSEVINRKVAIDIERGSIDFEMLSYSVGAQAELKADGSTTFRDIEGVNYDLIIDESSSNTLSLSPTAGGVQIITAPFTLDVAVAVNKIASSTEVVTLFVTARSCKIIRHGISAPQSAFWTTNISMVGKQIGLDGISHQLRG